MRRVLFILLLFTSPLLAGPKSAFKIVFSAYPEYCSPRYLDSIKGWGATGVSVFVNWWQYQPDSDRASIHFDRLQTVVKRIIADSLDVYLRIGLGQRPSWTIELCTAASRNGTISCSPMVHPGDVVSDPEGGSSIFRHPGRCARCFGSMKAVCALFRASPPIASKR